MKAEAMALWAVRSAKLRDIPRHVQTFLDRHEADEEEHLRRFELILDKTPRERTDLPSVPASWEALAVQLFGYEALGLEFAKLLATVRPDLGEILDDELVHVEFFERELRKIVEAGGGRAKQARVTAGAWWKRLPRTVERYLGDESLAPYRADLTGRILSAIESRFTALGLLTLPIE
ncbi:MAG: hypothetical protein U0231_19470 [Nitrospiraceae bacterium]